MFNRETSPSSFSRAVVLATAAALVLTVAVPPPVARARPAAPVTKAISAGLAAASDATDFSARRRVVRRGYRGGGNAAGLAFMGMALGTVGAIVAEQRRRDYYRDNYYYGGNSYYGGRYYSGQPYYGGGYYGY